MSSTKSDPDKTETFQPPAALADLSLTKKQCAFVVEYVSSGSDALSAARVAGYTENSVRTAAWRLMNNPLIIEAISILTAEQITIHAPRAVQAILTLMKTARSDYVKLQAAQDLLDRAGFRPPDKVQHSLSGSMNVELNLTGKPSPLIDATSEVIDRTLVDTQGEKASSTGYPQEQGVGQNSDQIVTLPPRTRITSENNSILQQALQGEDDV